MRLWDSQTLWAKCKNEESNEINRSKAKKFPENWNSKLFFIIRQMNKEIKGFIFNYSILGRPNKIRVYDDQIYTISGAHPAFYSLTSSSISGVKVS